MALSNEVTATIHPSDGFCPEDAIALYGQPDEYDGEPIADDFDYGDDDSEEAERDSEIGPAGGLDPPQDPVGETGG